MLPTDPRFDAPTFSELTTWPADKCDVTSPCINVDELTANSFVDIPLALVDVAGTATFRELKTWPGEIWEDCALSTADAQLATGTKLSPTFAITSFWREVTGKSFVYVFVGLSRCKQVMSLDK